MTKKYIYGAVSDMGCLSDHLTTNFQHGDGNFRKIVVFRFLNFHREPFGFDKNNISHCSWPRRLLEDSSVLRRSYHLATIKASIRSVYILYHFTLWSENSLSFHLTEQIGQFTSEIKFENENHQYCNMQMSFLIGNSTTEEKCLLMGNQ